ncbi:GntR family transcriptional regulator [Enterococcus florum]|uniref:GntR family transcriptional regulator n=1 Tax=Enterococcus florum TaxID=2480627 RepID=A0A4P5PAK9_9ENTE|nr:FCD domain-containing protein [Enterococcus florum]GCF93454.1 GntR family transcriptional regulator [Enterococcus florum]
MSNHRSLVNQTIEELLQFIEDQQLPIGAKLPVEAELAKQLKVGRSTLREAVKILAFSNVLDVRQGSGTYVKGTKFQEELSDSVLLTARKMLEIQAVEIIIKRGYELEEMIHLKELLFQRNQALFEGWFSRYVEADLAFHSKIIEMAHHPLLEKWYQEILPSVHRYLSQQMLKTSDFRDNTDLHEKLYQALLAKDYPTARQLIESNNSQPDGLRA